jgi:hypothetical protein
MTHRCLAALALVSIYGSQLAAQTGPGVQQPLFKSDLLDNLVGGVWSFVAAPGARPVRGGADAQWELGHQWLRLHQKEVDGPESVTYIGYDTYDRRLVAIRLDSISARGAETNGYGLQDGNKIVFTFDYPTIQYRQTLTWDPQAKSWQFLAETKSRRATTWTALPPLTLQRFSGRGLPPGGPRPQVPRPPQAPAVPLPPQ